jgi:hypothetical protein
MTFQELCVKLELLNTKVHREIVNKHPLYLSSLNLVYLTHYTRDVGAQTVAR